MRWQDYVWDATNILGALAFTIVFAIPALIVGPIVGLVPGLVAGIAILMLSRFRPPNFIEAAIIGTAASGGFGWLLAGIAHGDPPLFAAFFALCGLMAAWIAAAVARRRGIVVPADDPIAEPAPPSGDYSLFEPRLVERPWALVRLAALWAPLTAGMAGVLLTAVLRWQNSGLHIAAALLPAIGFGAYRGLVFGILPGIAVSVIVLLFEERRRPLSVVQIAVVGTLVCAFAAWLPAHWNGLGAGLGCTADRRTGWPVRLGAGRSCGHQVSNSWPADFARPVGAPSPVLRPSRLSVRRRTFPPSEDQTYGH